MNKKIYFEYNGYKVVDYDDPTFAKYQVTNTNNCFEHIETAILFCIGKDKVDNDSKLMTYIDTFMTMINK